MWHDIFVVAAALIGASAVLSGSLLNESYRRLREQRKIAFGLAGSIEATLIMTDRRGYVALAEGFVLAVRQGTPVKFPSALVAAAFWFLSATTPPPMTYEGMEHFPRWLEKTVVQPVGGRLCGSLRPAGWRSHPRTVGRLNITSIRRRSETASLSSESEPSGSAPYPMPVK
jgi:hypothetical protein